jgi:hypothetical protein
MKKVTIAIVLLAGLGWATVSARQAAQSVPGIGSGEINVRGVVGVANTVSVAQAGPRKVALDGTQDVKIENQPIVWIAPPTFIKAGGRYLITWNGGATETVTVSSVAGAGWIQISTTPPRWVNVTLAQGIEAR